MSRHIKDVVVFCGARMGNQEIFAKEAKNLGRALGQNGYNVVYGGGDVGLMGIIAREAAKFGVTVTGINVDFFNTAQGATPTDIVEESVQSMFARKARMLDLTQAAICLPGGIGTFDEIGESTVENDIMTIQDPDGHISPVILINTVIDNEGYYDDMLRQFNKAVKYGLASENIKRYYDDVPTAFEAVSLLNRLNAQGPVSALSEYDGLILPGELYIETIEDNSETAEHLPATNTTELRHRIS